MIHLQILKNILRFNYQLINNIISFLLVNMNENSISNYLNMLDWSSDDNFGLEVRK